MTKTALLIIDLQEDFLPPNGSLAVKDGRAIIKPIIDLVTSDKYKWDAIVATKDWHPSDHISFASTHKKEPFTEIMVENPVDKSQPPMKQVLWPNHCVQNSKGSEFPPEFKKVFEQLLAEQKVPTKLVLKGYLQDREYYSCFQDVWGIHKTECTQFLKDNGITDVVTVGIAYDYCVLNSSIDAAKNGFKTTVIHSLTKSVSPENEDKVTESYTSHNVKVIETIDELS